MAKIGDWVLIKWTTLTQEQRAPQVPEDTGQVPLDTWVKGYLQEAAEIGDEVRVKTLTGRFETGQLICINPTYHHSFGEFVPEVLEIGRRLQTAFYGGGECNGG